MSTDKTLADVQPGGRVQVMPSDAARALLAAQYRDDGDKAKAIRINHKSLTDSDKRALRAIESALSAQPSPGGQDAHEMADALERIAAGSLSDYEGVDADELHILRCAKLIRDLVARQPVGEPVAVIENSSFGGGGLLWIGPMPPIGTKLYTAPPALAVGEAVELARAKVKIAALELQLATYEAPAQAVDLAENMLSVLIEEGVLARNGRVFQKLRALIDSMAVGNG
jgi:hypothetical protein